MKSWSSDGSQSGVRAGGEGGDGKGWRWDDNPERKRDGNDETVDWLSR